MNDVAKLTQRLLVMNGACLAMDGTPEEVFERAEELLEMGLDIPEVTQILLTLKKAGLNVKPVYTQEAAVAQLMALEGGSLNA